MLSKSHSVGKQVNVLDTDRENHKSHNTVSNYCYNSRSLQKSPNSHVQFNFENFQTKLKVSQPGDVYEEEADNIAEQVVNINPTDQSKVMEANEKINRRCSTCNEKGEEDEEKMKITRKATTTNYSSNNFQISDNASKDINNTLSQSGTPIDSSTRGFMESRFGYDFSNVRIHTDEIAAESAQSLNASAYTIGNDIFFGEGQFRLDSAEGKRLLAHELAHTVQQTKASGQQPSYFIQRAPPKAPSKPSPKTSPHKNGEDPTFILESFEEILTPPSVGFVNYDFQNPLNKIRFHSAPEHSGAMHFKASVNVDGKMIVPPIVRDMWKKECKNSHPCQMNPNRAQAAACKKEQTKCLDEKELDWQVDKLKNWSFGFILNAETYELKARYTNNLSASRKIPYQVLDAERDVDPPWNGGVGSLNEPKKFEKMGDLTKNEEQFVGLHPVQLRDLPHAPLPMFFGTRSAACAIIESIEFTAKYHAWVAAVNSALPLDTNNVVFLRHTIIGISQRSEAKNVKGVTNLNFFDFEWENKPGGGFNGTRTESDMGSPKLHKPIAAEFIQQEWIPLVPYLTDRPCIMKRSKSGEIILQQE